MKKKIIAVSVLLSLATGYANASVRSASMGGTGVASGNYLEAPFTNPANLATFDESDDFGLLLPSVIVSVDNSDELQDKIDNVQFAYDELDLSLSSLSSMSTSDDITYAKSKSVLLREQLTILDGSSVSADINLGMAFAIPNKYVSLSIFTNSNVNLSSTVNVEDTDLEYLDSLEDASSVVDLLALDLDLNNKIDSSANVLGVAITDVGVSLAKSFEINEDFNVSVGISPKIQRVDLFQYNVDVESFEASDATNEEYRSDDSNFNVDLGVTVSMYDNFTIGVVAKNLVESTYSHSVGVETLDYTVGTEATVGLAYSADVFTIALDVDVATPDYSKSKYARLGAEVNAWDLAQVRVGYRYDIEEISADMYTLGIGVSPFNAFHLDAVAIITDEFDGGDSEFGAGLELSFTF